MLIWSGDFRDLYNVEFDKNKRFDGGDEQVSHGACIIQLTTIVDNVMIMLISEM